MEDSLKFKIGDIVKIKKAKPVYLGKVKSWTTGVNTNKYLYIVKSLRKADMLDFDVYYEDELELVDSKLIRALYGAE